ARHVRDAQAPCAPRPSFGSADASGAGIGADRRTTDRAAVFSRRGVGMTEYAHLDPALRRLADLSQRERIERIRVDRWVDYPRAREALDRLDELFLFPKRARMPNLLIFGPSGMGKTMIVEKFARAHPPVF